MTHKAYVFYFPFTLEEQYCKSTTFQWLLCMIVCFLYLFQSVTSGISHGAMMISLISE